MFKGDAWWWNEEVRESISRMKGTHMVMCGNNCEENKNRYKSMKNNEKKSATESLKVQAEVLLSDLRNY